MKITKEWLEEKNACRSGIDFVCENKLIGLETKDFIHGLMKADKLPWANWLIVRVMDKMQRVAYVIFAAEQVIDIFEKKYPKDKRPRKAIEAAKKYLENPNEENKNAVAYADAAAAAAAAADAYAASAAASAADAAAAAAADAAAAAAAYAAAYAAAAAAAYAASAAAADADAYAASAAAADAVAVAARKEMKSRILNYGLTLLKGE